MKTVEVDDVRDIEAYLGKLVERLDPDAVPTCDARAMWTKFVSISQLAMSGATLMARRGGEAPGWKRNGGGWKSRRVGSATARVRRPMRWRTSQGRPRPMRSGCCRHPSG